MTKPLANLPRHRIALMAIATSVLLQLTTISRYSFWFDESYTAALLKFGPSQIIKLTALDVHPPLFYLALKAYSLVFGTSDVALRSFSLVFMSLSLVLLYRLLLRITNRRAALIGLWFAALGPMVIRYGQEARMYGFSSTLIIGSTLVLVRQMQTPLKQRQNRWWVVYGLFIAAILYTHYFGALIVIAHGLYMLLANQKARGLHRRLLQIDKAWIAALFGAGVLYLPWVPTLLEQLNAVNGGFWIPPVSPRVFADTTGWFYWYIDLFKNDNQTLGLLAFLFLGVLASVIGWLALKRKLNVQALVLLVMPLVIVSVSLYVLSSLPDASSLFYVRYFSQYSALFYAGIGVLLATLSAVKKQPALQLATVLMVGVLAMQFVGVSRVLRGVDKSNNQTKLLYSRMIQEYLPGDVILTASFENFYDLDHYNQTPSPTRIVPPGVSYGSLAPIRERPSVIIDPKDVQPASGRVWYFRSYFYSTDNLPKSWEKVESVQELSAGEQILELYRVK